MLDSHAGRDVELGALRITRALPAKGRRLIGPWCFLDRFGPLTFSTGKPMDVAPHPHIGLQTVTWLLDGEVLHDDSLECSAVARPGGVNVMTAGDGIAHAEQTPPAHSGRLNGVQLWVALPDAHRRTAPSFQGVDRVPALEPRGAIVQVFSGSLGRAISPARHYSALLGADVRLEPGAALELELQPAFEHGMLLLAGDCAVDGEPLEARRLYHLGPGRAGAAFGSRTGGRLLLIGGPPFPEPILMWWNFVARTPEEIAAARADWEARRRFGDVRAYRGPRLDAPSPLRLATPNPMS